MPETAIYENLTQDLTPDLTQDLLPKASHPIASNLPSSRGWREIVQDYTELTKPRIITLLLITTAGAMWIASAGNVDLFLMLVTVTGGAIAAASANTINCLYDRDIDAKMERTSWRPLPSGRIQPINALIFAIALACHFLYVVSGLCQFVSRLSGYVRDRYLRRCLHDLAKAL